MSVIGGGPAGSACAIYLARAGRDVTLFEKQRFPRRKLCGGFVSGESIPMLKVLGIWEPLALEATRIERIEITSPSGRRAESELPAGGLSISRSSLDSLLLDAARRAGARVHEESDGWQQPVHGRRVIAAGRSVSPAKPHPPCYFGFQAEFEGIPTMTDQVALDFVHAGYVGWVRQRDRVNLCALLDHDAMRRGGPDLDGLLTSVSAQNPHLRTRLAEGRRVTAWAATGPVVMGRRRLWAGEDLFIGDAACVVDPFAGEGIAMALRSGQLAAEALIEQDAHAGAFYESRWEKAFQSSLRWQGWLRRLTRWRWPQEALVALAEIRPNVLEGLALRTRLA